MAQLTYNQQSNQYSPPPLGSEQPSVSSKPSWFERLKGTVSTILILIAAPLLALFLTAFVFQSYEVEGPSMSATLQDNDRLIVLKLPRSWSKVTGKPYIPGRGEIVIFKEPSSIESGFTNDKQLIKRVIALPGERVLVSDGTVTVYNQSFPNGFRPDKTGIYSQNVNYTSGSVDLTVPANELFVLGDNRNNSLDSRVFGTIQVKDVVGKLMLRLFPFGKIQRF